MHKKELLIAPLLIAACRLPFHATQISAPKDQVVYLTNERVSDRDNEHPYVTKRNWYMVYGFVPITNNSTADLIPPVCKEIGVISKKTAGDVFLNLAIRIGWSSFAFIGARQFENATIVNGIDLVNGVSQFIMPTLRTTKVICYDFQLPSEAPSSQPQSTSSPSSEPTSAPASQPVAPLLTPIELR